MKYKQQVLGRMWKIWRPDIFVGRNVKWCS